MTSAHEEVGNLIIPAAHALVVSSDGLQRLTSFARDQMQKGSVEDVFVSNARRLMPGFENAVHQKIASAIHQKIHEAMDQRKELTDRGATEEERTQFEADADSAMRAIATEESGDEEYGWKVREIWARTARGPDGLTMLFPSILVSAASDFEVLVAGLVRAVLHLRPEILRTSEAKYSYADVEMFESIVEFREHCAEQLAEAILRGGFEDWMDWFSKRLRVDVPGVTREADGLVEVFQRRHLWVHNGGKVNRLYLKKVSDPNGLSLGDTASVTFSYLSGALDAILARGLKLSFALLMKFSPGEDDMAGHDLHELTFPLLAAERFRVVEEVYRWYLDTVTDDSHHYFHQVNYWLSRKRQRGVDDIREEVGAWRTRSLDDLFKLSKHALLDDMEETRRLAEDLFDRGEISASDLRGWPLLEEFRAYLVDAGPDGGRLGSVVMPMVHEH